MRIQVEPDKQVAAERVVEEGAEIQDEKILGFLRRGFEINQLEALALFGVGRLSAVIHRLRKNGRLDDSESIETDNNDGYADYYMVDANSVD